MNLQNILLLISTPKKYCKPLIITKITKKATNKINTLQNTYDELFKKHQMYIDKVQQTDNVVDNSSQKIHVSQTAIEKYVDDLLSDPNINIYYLPDSIEKPIYVNTMKMLLSILQKSLNHINIDVVGHELKFHIEPQTPK